MAGSLPIACEDNVGKIPLTGDLVTANQNEVHRGRRAGRGDADTHTRFTTSGDVTAGRFGPA